VYNGLWSGWEKEKDATGCAGAMNSKGSRIHYYEVGSRANQDEVAPQPASQCPNRGARPCARPEPSIGDFVCEDHLKTTNFNHDVQDFRGNRTRSSKHRGNKAQYHSIVVFSNDRCPTSSSPQIDTVDAHSFSLRHSPPHPRLHHNFHSLPLAVPSQLYT